MLLARYGGNLSVLYQLDFAAQLELINTAEQQYIQETIFRRWIAGGYERQGVSYDKYKDSITSNSEATATMSTDEIYSMVESILG